MSAEFVVALRNNRVSKTKLKTFVGRMITAMTNGCAAEHVEMSCNDWCVRSCETLPSSLLFHISRGRISVPSFTPSSHSLRDSSTHICKEGHICLTVSAPSLAYIKETPTAHWPDEVRKPRCVYQVSAVRHSHVQSIVLCRAIITSIK